MSITAAMVKELREKTGAGMMDCKKALAETEGNMDSAIDWLRKKGLSAAAKKSGRVAAEGLVAAVAVPGAGVVLEVNAETDFVAKNEAFVGFVQGVAKVVLDKDPADVEALKALAYPGTGRYVGEELTQQIATIGENMTIRRFNRLTVASGVVASYVHGAGKIGVLVELTGASGDKVEELGRQIAMHVAAASPQYLCREDVPAELLEREKDVLRDKAKASGKPDNIIEKMLTGQVNKFFGEICLLEQAYVIDPDRKVAQVVEGLAKELGTEITLTRYARLQLGEGIEVGEDDFAAEVAKLTR